MAITRTAVAAGTGYIDNAAPQRLVDNNLGGSLSITILKAVLCNVDTAVAQGIIWYYAPRATVTFTPPDYRISMPSYAVPADDGVNDAEDVRFLAGFVVQTGWALFAKAAAASKLKHAIAYDQES